MERLEEMLERAATEFVYPPTPDIAGRVAARLARRVPWWQRPRLVWTAVAALLVVALALGLTPQVRAAVLEVLRLGAVRIFPMETPPPIPQEATATMPTPVLQMPVTATPPTATADLPSDRVSILDLGGETTLADAQERTEFSLRVPAYPDNLGLPDRVFAQYLNGQTVVMVWLDEVNPEQVKMSLFQLGPGALVHKGEPQVLTETSVHGARALWTQGGYVMVTRDGDWTFGRLIEGNVLIWTEGEITYRLESNLTIEEAIAVAESLVDVKVESN